MNDVSAILESINIKRWDLSTEGLICRISFRTQNYIIYRARDILTGLPTGLCLLNEVIKFIKYISINLKLPYEFGDFSPNP